MNNSIENLYKKGSTESTPVALDNFILNAAKQSCEDKPINKSQPRGWLYALSTAAVLVMGVTVVFNLQDQNSEIKTITEDVLKSPKLEQNKIQAQAISAPPLEPHPRPQKKRKMVTKKSEATAELSLGKVIADKATNQIETDIVIDKTAQVSGIVEKAYDAKSNTSFITRELTEAVGLNISNAKPEYKNNNTVSSSEINELKTMISEKKLQQATVLLSFLQKKYPNYDFTEINSLVNSIEGVSEK